MDYLQRPHFCVEKWDGENLHEGFDNSTQLLAVSHNTFKDSHLVV